MVDAATSEQRNRTGGERDGAGAPPGPAGGRRDWDGPELERPLGSYAALGTTFVGAFGGMLIAARSRLPERFSAGDIALVALGTHKLSRLVARDRVTRPLRAPFTEVQGEDPPLELNERASGHGLRRAVGELLSCPYCLDQWIAGMFIGGLVVAPRPTRATASMFAVVTGSDYLQHLHRWVRAREG